MRLFSMAIRTQDTGEVIGRAFTSGNHNKMAAMAQCTNPAHITLQEHWREFDVPLNTLTKEIYEKPNEIVFLAEEDCLAELSQATEKSFPWEELKWDMQ